MTTGQGQSGRLSDKYSKEELIELVAAIQEAIEDLEDQGGPKRDAQGRWRDAKGKFVKDPEKAERDRSRQATLANSRLDGIARGVDRSVRIMAPAMRAIPNLGPVLSQATITTGRALSLLLGDEGREMREAFREGTLLIYDGLKDMATTLQPVLDYLRRSPVGAAVSTGLGRVHEAVMSVGQKVAESAPGRAVAAAITRPIRGIQTLLGQNVAATEGQSGQTKGVVSGVQKMVKGVGRFAAAGGAAVAALAAVAGLLLSILALSQTGRTMLGTLLQLVSLMIDLLVMPFIPLFLTLVKVIMSTVFPVIRVMSGYLRMIVGLVESIPGFESGIRAILTVVVGALAVIILVIGAANVVWGLILGSIGEVANGVIWVGRTLWTLLGPVYTAIKWIRDRWPWTGGSSPSPALTTGSGQAQTSAEVGKFLGGIIADGLRMFRGSADKDAANHLRRLMMLYDPSQIPDLWWDSQQQSLLRKGMFLFDATKIPDEFWISQRESLLLKGMDLFDASKIPDEFWISQHDTLLAKGMSLFDASKIPDEFWISQHETLLGRGMRLFDASQIPDEFWISTTTTLTNNVKGIYDVSNIRDSWWNRQTAEFRRRVQELRGLDFLGEGRGGRGGGGGGGPRPPAPPHPFEQEPPPRPPARPLAPPPAPPASSDTDRLSETVGVRRYPTVPLGLAADLLGVNKRPPPPVNNNIKVDATINLNGGTPKVAVDVRDELSNLFADWMR